MNHTVIVYRISKDGRFIFPFSFKRPTEAAVAALRKYL